MCLKSGGSALLESKKGAKIIQVELLYGIRTIRLYGDATIEEQGKLSSCYEKNISQDTTCRKDFVIGCTENVLCGLGLEEVVTVFEKRYLQCLGNKRGCS
jgi:hypothetical protein